ncbi:MAG: aminotransferase class I/II-fold pyridoxal phosphate-dependent enzyme [Defluviitaleaceae bacterium]|nr:aminotransferase class I/II-fold pyridoxal phosphate-dependent enzyme [Defluviitaleaceae bacterium]
MYQFLQSYLEEGIYPFHMPGHKRNPMFFPQGMAGLDLTEIPGMDILRAPTGIIRDLQEAAASFYGADESYLLVNGSTAGIISAICAVCNEGSSLYAARNGHVSMYNGIALSGAIPKYILPETTPDGLAGGIKPAALDDMEENAAVFIVSPTYEGYVSNIKEIAARVHSKGGILIVDEAHGAHFKFHDNFPFSALELGADIVVQSFHKTLPALGQMAVLHVKGPRVDASRLKFYLQAVQTTSPSYMLMGQLDYVLKMLWQRPEIFETYVSRLSKIRIALTTSETQPVSLLAQERVGEYGIFDTDPGKLLFSLNVAGKAENISKIMADKYRIQMEMAAGRHLLAMTSVADTDEGFQRLWGAVGTLNIKLEGQLGEMVTKNDNAADSYTKAVPEMVMPPNQAIRQETEVIPWEKAAGRVAGEVIADYPPGIALVAPGERIPQGLPKLAQVIRVIK